MMLRVSIELAKCYHWRRAVGSCTRNSAWRESHNAPATYTHKRRYNTKETKKDATPTAPSISKYSELLSASKIQLDSLDAESVLEQQTSAKEPRLFERKPKTKTKQAGPKREPKKTPPLEPSIKPNLVHTQFGPFPAEIVDDIDPDLSDKDISPQVADDEPYDDDELPEELRPPTDYSNLIEVLGEDTVRSLSMFSITEDDGIVNPNEDDPDAMQGYWLEFEPRVEDKDNKPSDPNVYRITMPKGPNFWEADPEEVRKVLSHPTVGVVYGPEDIKNWIRIPTYGREFVRESHQPPWHISERLSYVLEKRIADHKPHMQPYVSPSCSAIPLIVPHNETISAQLGTNIIHFQSFGLNPHNLAAVIKNLNGRYVRRANVHHIEVNGRIFAWAQYNLTEAGKYKLEITQDGRVAFNLELDVSPTPLEANILVRKLAVPIINAARPPKISHSTISDVIEGPIVYHLQGSRGVFDDIEAKFNPEVPSDLPVPPPILMRIDVVDRIRVSVQINPQEIGNYCLEFIKTIEGKPVVVAQIPLQFTSTLKQADSVSKIETYVEEWIYENAIKPSNEIYESYEEQSPLCAASERTNTFDIAMYGVPAKQLHVFLVNNKGAVCGRAWISPDEYELKFDGPVENGNYRLEFVLNNQVIAFFNMVADFYVPSNRVVLNNVPTGELDPNSKWFPLSIQRDLQQICNDANLPVEFEGVEVYGDIYRGVRRYHAFAAVKTVAQVEILSRVYGVFGIELFGVRCSLQDPDSRRTLMVRPRHDLFKKMISQSVLEGQSLSKSNQIPPPFPFGTDPLMFFGRGSHLVSFLEVFQGCGINIRGLDSCFFHYSTKGDPLGSAYLRFGNNAAALRALKTMQRHVGKEIDQVSFTPFREMARKDVSTTSDDDLESLASNPLQRGTAKRIITKLETSESLAKVETGNKDQVINPARAAISTLFEEQFDQISSALMANNFDIKLTADHFGVTVPELSMIIAELMRLGKDFRIPPQSSFAPIPKVAPALGDNDNFPAYARALEHNFEEGRYVSQNIMESAESPESPKSDKPKTKKPRTTPRLNDILSSRGLVKRRKSRVWSDEELSQLLGDDVDGEDFDGEKKPKMRMRVANLRRMKKVQQSKKTLKMKMGKKKASKPKQY